VIERVMTNYTPHAAIKKKKKPALKLVG